MTNQVKNDTFTSTHDIGASRFKLAVWIIIQGALFSSLLNPFSKAKVTILKLFGAKMGKGIIVKPGVRIKYPWKLSVGDHTWLGENVWIDNIEQVTIGANVCLSQGALILTGGHQHTKSSFDYNGKKIILEDGVWIGARAIVMRGVTCKSHSILSVNSVAAKDLEAYTIYRGNPAVANEKKRVIT